MTDTITVDLDRAKQLVEDAAQTWPERTDSTGLYFDIDGGCLCVVGAALQSLDKGPQDMHPNRRIREATRGRVDDEDANMLSLRDLDIDGVTFTREGLLYLMAAQHLNDSLVRWGEIPQATEGVMSIAEGELELPGGES